jgi:hypothetical protein
MARKRCQKQSLPEPEIKVLAIPCTNPKLTLQKILEIPTSPLEASLITIFLKTPRSSSFEIPRSKTFSSKIVSKSLAMEVDFPEFSLLHLIF